MKRKSKEHVHGAIAKRRIVPKVPLCHLPVDILSHILSQLPINDAIRTSVLSRKWKYIWCNHTNLTFNPSTVRKHYSKSPSGYEFVDKEEFIRRVDTVLHQHSGVGIKHLEFKYTLHNKHADHVDRWIDFAITSKVNELIIDLLDECEPLLLSRDLAYGADRVREEPYSIPSKLFSANNGSYLQRVELTYVSMQLPADFKGFLNLKTLTLVDVRITDEDVNHMLSKCSLLEFLKIAYCRMVTSLRMPHPLDQLKHLVVDTCPLLQEIELNCSPTTLQYTGTVVPLVFTSTLRLTNVCVKFLTYHAVLDYIVNGFPSTLPSLETLTLLCAERERIILPGRPFKFSYLRHLKLELVIFGYKDRKTDVLGYAHVLEVAPFIEKLELCMWMNCRHQPYHKEDGELRSRPSHQHTNLKFVRFSGFFGHKDQVELALHILRSSVVLEKMEITPSVQITGLSEQDCCERAAYLDGYRVANEFVRKADHRNVVETLGPSFPGRPRLDYGRGRGKTQMAVQRRQRGGLARWDKGHHGRHGKTPRKVAEPSLSREEVNRVVFG